MPNSNQKAHDRDVDDVGRVLGALLKDNREPAAIVQEYVTQDLSALKLSKPIFLEIPRLIGLLLCHGSVIRRGGGGIVIQCVNRDVSELQYALKVTRPSLLKDTLEESGEELSRSMDEYLKHAPLSHKNVARVFGAGDLTVRLQRNGVAVLFNPILMEWIEDATPMVSYLVQNVVDWRVVIEILAQSFDGFHHLHTRSLIHWDLKSDNVLVDRWGTPKITDIGNARRSVVFQGQKAFSTRRNLPPELLKIQPLDSNTSEDSSRRTPVFVPDRKWDSPWLDLWMFSRELNRLFAADKEILDLDKNHERPNDVTENIRSTFLNRTFPKHDVEAQYALRYVRLVIRQLLYPSEPTDASCYGNGDAVAITLRKLFQEFGAAQSVEELQAIPQKVIRLARSGNAPYTTRFSKFYNSSLIRQTTRHLQLGTLVQVYPSGSHRRSEHIAGVVSTAAQYVRALYANRTEPFWRISIARQDIDALFLAALLHDVGHMSFGHALEDMVGLFRGRTHEDYAQLLLSSAKTPPRVAAQRAELREILSKYWANTADELQNLLNLVANILRPPPAPNTQPIPDPLLDPVWTEWIKIRLLHSIIDSAIDADKLDYLLRDAHHCGVKYAEGVDTDRFYQSLCPILFNNNGTPDACIGVTEKGTLPVESMLVARYQMFMSVYWHHTARAHTALLQYAVQQYIGTDSARAGNRLDELAHIFRTEDDGGCLRWLRRSLNSRKKTQPIILNICDALQGVREKLYWPAFELRYARDPGPAQALIERLTSWADALAKARDPGDFVRLAKALRDQLSKRVTETIQRERKKQVIFKDGEILVDIPPPGKDQVENIWIWLEERQGQRRPIQALSPLADAVGNAFKFWARRIRVFLAPSAWEKLHKLGLSDHEIHDLFWKVLLAMDRALGVQGQLDFDAYRQDA